MNDNDPTSQEARRVAWHDDPLTDEGDDRLDRAPFARHVARLIRANHSPTTSVVFGLEGPWGSGKSTVVNFVERNLEKSAGDRWTVAHFTPWATSGADALFAEFFNALIQVAPDAKTGAALREKICRYAAIARPIAAAIPYVGSAIVEGSRSAEQLFSKPWDLAFREVSEELSSLKTAVLVVVDDIDRLQPQELLDLLKVVRLLGRFPGVDYLLAYDERTIVDTLQDPQRGTVTKARARAFMEKIVQYPVTLPPLLNQTVVELLDTGLTDIITQPRIDSRLDIRRLQKVLTEVAPRLLRTPRAVARYLAQVRSQFDMHDQEEIDDTDLVLATLLRIRLPDLFEEMQHHKADLTRGTAGGVLRMREDEPTDWGSLLSRADDLDRDDARSILAAIFPAVADKNPAQARAPRFAHPQYFDRYLSQAIPAGDIPDRQISAALEQAADGDDRMLRDFLLAEDRRRARLALGRILSRYPAVTEPWRRDEVRGPVSLQLLSAGMTLLPELPAEHNAIVPPIQQLSVWMSNLLARIIDDDTTAPVRNALDRCPDVTMRADVVSRAHRDPDDRLSKPTRSALAQLFRSEATLVLDVLLEDLHAGDASSRAGNTFLYELVIEAGMLDDLRRAVREGLDAGAFTIEDVGARFVGFWRTMGIDEDNPSGARFSGELFTQITGVDARSSDHIERSEGLDTSWPSRRRIAAEHLIDSSERA